MTVLFRLSSFSDQESHLRQLPNFAKKGLKFLSEVSIPKEQGPKF